LALYYCYKLTKGDAEHEPEAAFAPQAYYAYFWDILSAAEEEGPRWEAFFERALDLVKVCDAVYFYTTSGIPEDGDLSEGIKKSRLWLEASESKFSTEMPSLLLLNGFRAIECDQFDVESR
jgi:hypothetical protein